MGCLQLSAQGEGEWRDSYSEWLNECLAQWLNRDHFFTASLEVTGHGKGRGRSGRDGRK